MDDWKYGKYGKKYEQYSFDANSNLTSLRKRSGQTITFTYDDLSRRSTVTLGNGTTTSYSYNTTQGALASLTQNLTGTAQDQSYTYSRNQAGEITTHSWSNDLYQWSGAVNGSKAYSANGLNQYNTVAGTSYIYDSNGNLNWDGTAQYSYDYDNRLMSANGNGISASFAYDPEGRLRRTTLSGSISNLLYDGTDLIAEYDPNNNTIVRRYVHGPGVDEPLVWYEGSGTTSKTWLYADHQGSIVAQADGTGTSTATYSYGPYGEAAGVGNSRFRYTGQQYFPTLGLYYYKARFYSAAQGRFLQTDPIGYQDDNNLYAYVGNGPVNRIDPYGLKLVGVPLPAQGGVTRTFLFDEKIAAAMSGFVDDVRAAGIPVTVNLAFRTTQEQAVLYANRANNPNPVAVPGASRHESGFAIDINGADPTRGLSAQNRVVIENIAAQYGLSTVGGRRDDPTIGGRPVDPPHFDADPTAYGYSSRAEAIKTNQLDYQLHELTDFSSLSYLPTGNGK